MALEKRHSLLSFVEWYRAFKSTFLVHNPGTGCDVTRAKMMECAIYGSSTHFALVISIPEIRCVVVIGSLPHQLAHKTGGTFNGSIVLLLGTAEVRH